MEWEDLPGTFAKLAGSLGVVWMEPVPSGTPSAMAEMSRLASPADLFCFDPSTKHTRPGVFVLP